MKRQGEESGELQTFIPIQEQGIYKHIISKKIGWCDLGNKFS